MTHGNFQLVLILLVSSVLIVGLFRHFRLPPILGYLCVGILVGPHGLGWVPDTADTRYIAEFGVVFLMFTIGLEFSLPQLIAMRKTVLGMGGAQVMITTAVIAIVCKIYGLSTDMAIIIGGTLAMSSTAIVSRQLSEQLELHSRHGRKAVGVLLFQDLAVIPFLIMVPAMADATQNSMLLPLGWALLKGAAVLAVMLAIGHWLMRPLFRTAANTHSPDLFMLTVLLFTLAAAWLTHEAGLSLVLGAFLAGIMVGETEFRHQVEADIRPFRDILLGLFFVTVGMLFDIHVFAQMWPWVLLITILLVIGKLLLITALGLAMKTEAGVALRTGLTLAQGGEFGFVLISLAMAAGIMTASVGQVILASIIISMMLAPLIIRYNGHLAKQVFAASYGANRANIRGEIAADAHHLHHHVIICGYGRIGQNIARFLEQENFQFIAIDLDPVRVREARKAGEQVNYGDSTHVDILEAAGLERARALVISFEEPGAALKILENTRRLRPDMPILVRTRDDTNLEKLQQAGATEVVPETLEASLMLSSHLLLLLGIPVSAVVRRVREVRSNRYSMLRGFFLGEERLSLTQPDSLRRRLYSVVLTEKAHAIGKTLQSLNLENTGVIVSAIRRGGIRGPQPEPDTELMSGDVLVVYGTMEEIERAEAILLGGG